MTMDLTKLQAYLLSAFQAFQQPISYELAAHLAHQAIPQLKELATPLIERGLLQEKGEYLELCPDIPVTGINPLTGPNKENWITEIIQAVRSHGSSHNNDVLNILNLLWARGNVEDATHLAWDSINDRVKEQRYAMASEISVWVYSRLGVIMDRPELWPTAIDLVLLFTRLHYIIKKYHLETVKALELVKEPCRRLGDERRLALVLLHLGRRYNSLNELQKSVEYFRDGFRIVERLDDSDIKGRAGPFYAAYYSFQGLSKKAMVCFERIGYPDLIETGNPLPDPQLIVLACIQAAMAGKYQIAIGSLNANWKRVARSDDQETANYYRGFLGQVLLMNGMLDEARLHLDAVLANIDAQEDQFLHFCVSRAKAYYLLVQGRNREAYEMLCKCVGKSYQQGWHRFYWGFPWVLEMLHSFHCNGYLPIPHYEYEAEIKNALAGQNPQSKGVALRIRADEASIARQNSKVVGKLLLASEKFLIESGNPAEIVKTRAQLALWHNQQGDQVKARLLARQAWQARHSLGGQQLPVEICSLVGDQPDTAPEMINGRDIMIRFLDMIDDWQPNENRQKMFHQIIVSTTLFFRTERGGLFLFEGQPGKQHLVLYTGCNLSPEDIDEDILRLNHQLSMKILQSNRPLIIREPVTGDAICRQGIKSVLCIPLELSDTERGMLYYDSLHLYQAFDWCDSETLTRISESIISYINRVTKFTQYLSRQRHLAIPNLTELSEEKSGFFHTSGQLFKKVLQRADRASLSDAPVLILGETGVGKEVIAKRVHLTSNRRDKPFIAVNLASIPETLLESELFGHEKGAFTGADRQKLGRMELANKGTLFIDEVGEIPKFVQVKLLRALEEMSFVRIGGEVKREVDFRLIAATNRDLTKEVEMGNFRADLYYRLNVIPIFLPPLRERGDDVLDLAQKFLEQASKKYRVPNEPLMPEDKKWIKSYHWPGNIRELKNVMERAVILNSSPTRPVDPMVESLPSLNHNVNLLTDNPTMDEMQRRYISSIMEKTNQNLSQAANILGMKRPTLHKRMVKLGLK